MWKIQFDQATGLRTLVDVVSNLLTRISFRILKREKDNTHYLCIDSIDPQHICMIQARLVCDRVEIGDGVVAEDMRFCVESNVFSTLLKNTPPHYSLHLSVYTSSANVSMDVFEQMSMSHTSFYELPTLVDDSKCVELTDMDYKYTIEIDLSTLRQIVKTAMSLHAQHIEFSVHENERTLGTNTTHTMFSIASNGNAQQRQCFHSLVETTHTSSETCVIRAATDSSGPPSSNTTCMIEKYVDCFSPQYLTHFLKSMERQIMTMRLSKDKPLVVNYPLGADESFICFVLAPKHEDSGDE